MSVVTVDPSLARGKFLRAPFALRHGLSGHTLFTLERLVQLAQSMPRDQVEYNSGRVMSRRQAKDNLPLGMPREQVIRRIEMAGAGMVIKGIERDPAYAAILKTFVDDAQAASGKRHGDYSDLQGFISVSPVNSATPFDIDAQETILIQIRGDKFVHIFENADRSLVPEEAMENSPSKYRLPHYEPSYEARAQVFEMKEGDAVYMPYLWPHWVRTGARYSVSMAMMWKTPEVNRLNKIRQMNGMLRRFGVPQPGPGVSPLRDAVKIVAHDAMRAVIDPVSKLDSARQIFRGVIYGKRRITAKAKLSKAPSPRP